MNRATLTALIHGESGVGKSWLGDTVPAPRLILDAEGRAKYTPSGPKKTWNPKADPPPVYDGTWETCIVTVTDFETLNLVYQWLRSGQHPFVSVVIDSLMEAQKRCIDNVVPGIKSLDQQDWGTVLRSLEKLMREYRDLTLVENNAVTVVVFITGSTDDDGPKRPLLQGQIRSTSTYYMDVVGYLFLNPLEDGTFVRTLLVHKQPGFAAKDGTGRLPGPFIPNPHIEQLYQLLTVNYAQEAVA